MMLRYLATFSFLIFTFSVFAQKKALKIEDFDQWETVQSSQISTTGQWISFEVEPQLGDKTLHLQSESGEKLTIQRGKRGQLSYDESFFVCLISPQTDSIRLKKLQAQWVNKKLKPEEFPKDSLCIVQLEDLSIEKIANVQSFQMPQKSNDWLLYLLAPEEVKKDTTNVSDTTQVEQKKEKKLKKESKENGSKLVLRNLKNQKDSIFPFVTDYQIAKKGHLLTFISTGSDSLFEAGVYAFNVDEYKLYPLQVKEKGTFKNISVNEEGSAITFISRMDTTKENQAPFNLHFWKNSDKRLLEVQVRDGLIITENCKPNFSISGKQLKFLAAKKSIAKDSTILDEEKAQLDVWHWQDGQLQPQQKLFLKENKELAFQCLYETEKNKIHYLEDNFYNEAVLASRKDAQYAVLRSSKRNEKLVSWESWPYRYDVALYDLKTQSNSMIAKDLRAIVSISPSEKYLFWYNIEDTAYYTYDIRKKTINKVATSQTINLADELHDLPSLPGNYGVAGWLENDDALLIYDRFDLWQIDPSGKNKPKQLTQGRAEKIRFRYLELDEEETFISKNRPWILEAFNEKTRSEAFHSFDLPTNKNLRLYGGDFGLGSLQKAEKGDHYLFKKGDYVQNYDLYKSKSFSGQAIQLSNINPQQAEFQWGSVELVSWISANGDSLEGLLYKPENFDPNRQYPMLVYFYERVSDRLHNYIAPSPSASTIRPSFYNSNDYIVFMPDITYRTGHPGQSAEDAIVSGTLSIIDKGFVNPDRIGIQGQSWGGYQVAHLVTQTNLFSAAMAGAPVSNMTSAYGGIRWGSGFSRMFQYENTQSRIGGTLWDKTQQYFENSPIFHIPKVETPLLIMHNDDDGAVPWYQGIEMFVAMRRLNKPCWMLTYNNEEHNLKERRNRLDLSRRMQQFFDHYLKDQPMPMWMKEGVPAYNKGLDYGFDVD